MNQFGVSWKPPWGWGFRQSQTKKRTNHLSPPYSFFSSVQSSPRHSQKFVEDVELPRLAHSERRRRTCPCSLLPFVRFMEGSLLPGSLSVRPAISFGVGEAEAEAALSNSVSPLPTLSHLAWRLCVSSSSSECPPSSPLGRTSVQLALSISSGSSKATVIELSLSQFALLLAEAEKAQAVVEG